MKWLTIINTSCIVILIYWLLCNTGLNTTAINKVEELEIKFNTIQTQPKDTFIIQNNVIVQK